MSRNKIRLPTVTLLGADCVNLPGLSRAAEISAQRIEFGAIKLLSSVREQPRFGTVTPIPHIGSIEEYSRFMIEDAHRHVETDHVLCIQSDGFVLNPDGWTDRFLEYDYIGAPWNEGYGAIGAGGVDLGGPRFHMGNGGFSLRSRRLLQAVAEVARQGRFPHKNPEDIAICANHRTELEGMGMRFAPLAVAARFALENYWNGTAKWKNQFGFHGIRHTDISRWTECHPEWGIINTYHAASPWRWKIWKSVIPMIQDRLNK